MGFEMAKLALGQVSLLSTLVYPVSIIPPRLQSYQLATILSKALFKKCGLKM